MTPAVGGGGTVRILLTGISGVGKSTLAAALAARGQRAVDLDAPAWSTWVTADAADEPAEWGTPVERDRDWVWREDRVRALLAEDGDGPLFVSGCAANQRLFRDRFDHVVLLTAPRAVIAARLVARTTNAYGKLPTEAARVLAQVDTVEPLLRRSADQVIDTDAPLAAVLDRVLAIARTPRV